MTASKQIWLQFIVNIFLFQSAFAYYYYYFLNIYLFLFIFFMYGNYCMLMQGMSRRDERHEKKNIKLAITGQK